MKSRTLFLAAVLSLCLGAVVSAQQTTVEGTVVSNSGGTLVLNTAEGTRTFLVDGQTSLPASLAAGTRVTIEYQTTSDNQMHAFKVTPAAGATTPSTSSSATTGSSTSMTDTTGTTSGDTPANPTTGTTRAPDTTATTGTTSGNAANPTDANATGTATTTPSTTGTATTGSTGTTSDPYASGSTMQQPSSTGSSMASPSTTSPSTTSADTTATTDDTTGNRLPATASPLPLIALVGTLALAAGLALRLRHA